MFGLNWLSGSREQDKNVKRLQTDRLPDRLGYAILTFQLSWAKKNPPFFMRKNGHE